MSSRAISKVAVLKGGPSAERDVSLVSGRMCAAALRTVGFDVTEVDAGPDLSSRLVDIAPDVVFNALHGRWGEDGCVQGLLEWLGLPYTHSGVLASALAMDKHRAKIVMRAAGVTVADGGLFDRLSVAENHPIAMPYVVKPNGQGSSKSVYIVWDDKSNQSAAIAADIEMGERVVVEAYIPGRELTVSVKDGEAICVTEIIAAADRYFEISGRRLTFEYVLLAGINDRIPDAEELGRLLRGRPALLNIIPYNPVAGLPFQTPSKRAIADFREILSKYQITVKFRQRKGDEINAACGQLRRSNPSGPDANELIKLE